jgi:hypothetical protein
MKIITLLLVLFLFFGCAKNKDGFMKAIEQNNSFLQNEISIYNARLYMKCLEQPFNYDSITCKKMTALYTEVSTLKNYSDFRRIKTKMHQLVHEEKLNLKYDSITSNEQTILKNNLYLYLMNINKAYYRKSNAIYDITYIPFVKNTIKNDTVILDFYNHNSFVVTTDSIIDKKDRIVAFSSYIKNNIWQIKYPNTSKESTFYGKVLEIDSDGNTHLVKNIKHTITH